MSVVRSHIFKLSQSLKDSDSDIDIAYITETHLKSSNKIFIDGFKIHASDRDSGIHTSGGVAILVKTHFVLSA